MCRARSRRSDGLGTTLNSRLPPIDERLRRNLIDGMQTSAAARLPYHQGRRGRAGRYEIAPRIGQRLELGQALPRLGQLGLYVVQPLLKFVAELLQLDDALDAGEVHALVLAEPLDLAQQGDIAGAVAAPAAGRAARLDQTQPV